MKKRLISLIVLIILIFSSLSSLSTIVTAEKTDAEKYQDELDNYYDNFDTYRSLWYDDGHLLAFVDMADFTEAQTLRLSAANDDGAKNARLILGAAKTAKESGVHSYVRISAGKYEGKYFMLATNDTTTKGITILADGRLDFDETYSTYGNGGEGIYMRYAYDQSVVGKSTSINTVPTDDNTETLDFMVAKDTMQADGSYGRVTVENSAIAATNAYKAKRNAADTAWLKIVTLSGRHFGHIGTTQPYSEIQWFGTSGTAQNSAGLNKQVSLPLESSVHYTWEAKFIGEKTFKGFCRMITSGSSTGILRTTSGTDVDMKTYADIANTCVLSQGVELQYVRVYDSELTDLQLMQNHMADVLYSYKIENVDKLVELGTYAINEAFVKKFMSFDIGTASPVTKQTVQSMVDNKIKEFDANLDGVYEKADQSAIKALIETNYAEFSALKKSTDDVAAEISSVSTDIQNKITTANQTVAVNTSAEQVMAEQMLLLQAEKTKADADVQAILKIKGECDLIENDVKTKYNTDKTSSDTKTLLALNNLIVSKLGLLDDRQKNANFKASMGDVYKANAQKYLYAINSINAQASFNIGEYVGFAGYQVRNGGYMAMRAVFTASKTKLAEKYNYCGIDYEIVTAGLLFANTDTYDKIQVSYDEESGKVSTNIGKIVSFEERYELSGDVAGAALNKTQVGDTVYEVITSFATVPYENYKSAFSAKYTYRAYVVLSGGNTSFVCYYNPVSENLGEKVSLYDVAQYVHDHTDDEDILDSESYVSQIINYVTEGEGK